MQGLKALQDLMPMVGAVLAQLQQIVGGGILLAGIAIDV
jgi:hypothetical protein